MKFGAIDIGTNAARLLIGEVVQNGHPFIKKISYTRVPLRLGMDVFENGKISDHKIIEFRKTIQAFKLLAEVNNVVEIRACATSAMREASNGTEVRRYIHSTTDVDIEIIDGETESQLILSNFQYLGTKNFVVVDVGGGSTEISIFQKGNLIASKSFGIGSIRLLKSKVKDEMWDKSKSWIKKNLENGKDYTVFATGGNINKAHKMLGKKSDETIKLKEFIEFTKKIQGMSAKERINEYKLKADRADVIGTASRIYSHVFKTIGSEEISVPKIGLSDGIIHGLNRKYRKD